MKLKCKINGIEYDTVQGIPFSDEYNETLDSASIIISQVDRIEDIKPYDDVYIYDNEFNGYGRYKKEFKDAITLVEEQKGDFWLSLNIPDEFMRVLFGGEQVFEYKIRIILIQGNEEESTSIYCDCFITYKNGNYYFSIPNINLKEKIVQSPDDQNIWVLSTMYGNSIRIKDFYASDNVIVEEFYIIASYDINNNKFYKHFLIQNVDKDEIRLEDKKKFQYTILLWSETKGLETIPLPNFSITQPLDIKLKKSVYNYIVDIVDMYSPLYKVVDNENNQTWKYEKKYIVDSNLKDVFGDVYSPDFTLNNPNLRDVLSQLMLVKDMIPYVQDGVIKAMDITQRKGEFSTQGVNYIKSNLSGSNYCTSLKRTYSDALSEQKSCRLTEYLSFRNSDNALLTIDNMRIETTYPIYKINKLYMCYYKKFKIKTLDSEDIEKVFLCKQDISKLVKLNSERNVLSEDWSKFNVSDIKSVDDLAKFKIGTIGYDIGSKSIDGWGAKYTSYLLFNWFPQANTYVQKIFEFMDDFYPYGIYNYSYLKRKSNISSNQNIEVISAYKGGLVTPFDNEYPAGLKGLLFEIEYESFYNGTIYHSKDNLYRDDIVVNDNSSSSLTLLEQDGIMQKEKINRFGNEVFQFNARYKDIGELQELGSVYNSEDGKDTDIIIYSREFTVQDNVINCRYIGAKDYVLKNYFTSVYAKHRPYNLMSYGESVYRAENKKIFLMLSLDKKVIEQNKNVLILDNFGEEYVTENKTKSSNSIWKLLSFLKPTLVSEKMDFLNFDKINYGFYEFKGNKYASDVNVFTSADSLCFNLKMYDNVGAGVYIDSKNIEPFDNLKDFITVDDDVKGSLQEWYLTVDDVKTGFAEKMSFYVGHIDKERLIPDGVILDVDDVVGKSEEPFNAIKTEENGTQTSVVEVYYEVLNDEAVYKNIFDLPQIDVGYSDITNLIGNEYTLKKDNKELIDMTFQIEPITNNDKILYSPWMMKLSDLNGVYNKFSKSVSVSDSGNYDSFVNKVDFQSIGVTIYDTRDVFDSRFYPVMILAIPTENLDEEEGKTVATLEGALKNNSFVNIQSSFVFDDYNTSLDPKFLYNKIHKLTFDATKIKYYDKNYITVEGTQYLTWEKPGITFKKQKDVNEMELKFKKVDKIWGLIPPAGVTWFVFDTKENNIYVPGRFSSSDNVQYLLTNGKWLPVDADSDLELNTSQINSANSQIENSSFSSSSSLIYSQNMFVTTSNEPMKKHHVYNQYKTLEEIGLSEDNTGPLVSDVFYFVDDDKLVVDLYSFEHEMDEVKSVQLWYRDEGGALNFVFGVNVDESDFEKRRLEIHISLITHKDMRVFDKFHNVIGEVKNVANSEDVEDLTKQKYEKYIEK